MSGSTDNNSPASLSAEERRETIDLDSVGSYMHRRMLAAEAEALRFAARERDMRVLIEDQARTIAQLQAALDQSADGAAKRRTN